MLNCICAVKNYFGLNTNYTGRIPKSELNFGFIQMGHPLIPCPEPLISPFPYMHSTVAPCFLGYD
jgi:hypothetical protein